MLSVTLAEAAGLGGCGDVDPRQSGHGISVPSAGSMFGEGAETLRRGIRLETF